jgi:hypothetical protein
MKQDLGDEGDDTNLCNLERMDRHNQLGFYIAPECTSWKRRRRALTFGIDGKGRSTRNGSQGRSIYRNAGG